MAEQIDPTTGYPIVTTKDINAHTEQALVQLVYVQTSNDMIGGAMSNLDTALNTTQSVLNILQALQNLHNEISVKSKSAFPFLFSTGGIAGSTANIQYVNGVSSGTDTITNTAQITGAPQAGPNGGMSLDPSSYQAAYNKAASAYFGKAIDPNFVFFASTQSGYADFRGTLSALKTNLAKEITSLSAQAGASGNQPGTLLNTVQKVYSELPSNFKFSTVEKWALDNYNSTSTNISQAGALQNDLTSAITAAQNLNDTQKENVRRFLFIFQEYYQSAAAVLSSIDQAVEQMAQKISQ